MSAFQDLLNSSPPPSPSQAPPGWGLTHDEPLAGNGPSAEGEGQDNDDSDTATGSAPPPEPVAQDFTQFGSFLALGAGLNAAKTNDLLAMAAFPNINLHFIWLGAQVLAVLQKLETLHPPEVTYTISATLTARIDETSARIFLSSTLGEYKGRASKLVLGVLKKNTQWGVTTAVADDPVAMKAITGKVNGKLTHHRNDSKDIIYASLGTWDASTNTFRGQSLGIYELTSRIILAVGGKTFYHEISIPLVARVAFLRCVYTDELAKTGTGKAGPSYWDTVDLRLKEIRKSKANDAARITRVFSKILEDDRKVYGNIAVPENLDNVPLADPNK